MDISTKNEVNHTFGEIKNQLIAVLFVNFITFSHGCVSGWTVPTLLLLLSDDTPLISGKIDMEETSWIGSLTAIGGILGTMLFGFIGTKIGRKNTLGIIAFPQIVFWIIIIFATYPKHLFIARLIVGLTGGGLFLCIPLYVSEIASPHIRGTLGNLFNIIFSLGSFSGYVIGTYIQFSTSPYVLIVLPIIYVIGLFLLPETPQFMLNKNKISEAEISLRFYRNHPVETSDLKLCEKFNNEFEKLQLNKKIIDETENKLKYSDFCTSIALKALFCGIFLTLLNTFSGFMSFLTYSSIIFNESGTDLNPNNSTIFLGIITICGSCFATIFTDKIGRRKLLIYTTFGACLSLIIYGIFILLHYNNYNLTEFHWVPLACLSVTILFASSGFIPLIIIIIPEVFPLNIRSVATTLCAASITLFVFINLKVFPIILEVSGLHTCLWISATFCGLGTLFGIFILKETNGADINVIAKTTL